MKRSQLLLATIALPIDYFMLVLAGLVAYQLRFQSWVREFRPVVFHLPLAEYFPLVLAAAAVCLLLFALAGLYALTNQLKLSQEIGRLFLACSAGLALIIVLFFFNPQLFSSRFIVLAAWLLSFVLTSLGRVALRLGRTNLYRRGWGVSRVLLAGSDEITAALGKLFHNSPQLGYKVVQQIAPSAISNLNEFTSNVDEVVVGDPTLTHEFTLRILEYCVTHHLGFKYAADMFEAQSHNVLIHTLAGVPLIEIKRTALDGWGRVAKRIFDLIMSVVLLAALSPLLLCLGLIIWFDSGQPVVVALERIGEAGEKFRLFKFRSMVHNAHLLKDDLRAYNERPDGPLFKMANDPRVTKFGRLLRRTSLDELPQLWNVIRGDMSLVGPRPHEPNEVASYQLRHHKLLNIKPGITGMAQISGRSNLSFEDETKLDTFYIENWSLNADLVILVKTIVVVLQHKNAV
ncbi:MAG: sugar transferase [Candidatus Kerfeldbacteria bacterium]|nr:sugar transferase [Candidatus Kerfeldbacteria bacterium]